MLINGKQDTSKNGLAEDVEQIMMQLWVKRNTVGRITI